MLVPMYTVHSVTCCRTDLTTALQVVSAVYSVHCTLNACREHDCESDSCRTVGLTVLQDNGPDCAAEQWA